MWDVDKTNPKSRLMVLKMALKCADVGHAAKVLTVVLSVAELN
jgi:hypothetical protein